MPCFCLLWLQSLVSRALAAYTQSGRMWEHVCDGSTGGRWLCEDQIVASSLQIVGQTIDFSDKYDC